MSVTLDGDIIRLEGDCGVEQAEALARLLEDAPQASVDLGKCRLAHTAIVQALLCHRARLTGDAADPFLRDFVLPELQRAAANIDLRPTWADDSLHMGFSQAGGGPGTGART